jgi:hypothetical protein
MRLSAPQSVCEIITEPSAETFLPTAMMVHGYRSVAASSMATIIVNFIKESGFPIIIFGEFV